MRGRVALALLASAAGAPAQAEQYWTRTKIVAIAAVAEDLDYPRYRDTVFIGVEDKTWLPEKCRKMPGLLARSSDVVLFDLAVRAFETGHPVVVKADDQKMIGEYCRFFQITFETPPPVHPR